jgi:hypothetical protein
MMIAVKANEMGYRVHKQDDKYKVVEVNEGEVKDVATGLEEDKAKEISRGLNYGNGFDGFTPDFFCNRFEV